MFACTGVSESSPVVVIYRINNSIIFWDLTNPSTGNSPCLISLALNEQPLLARLRPAGGKERIAVIGESTEKFVLCRSIRPDFDLNVKRNPEFFTLWLVSLLTNQMRPILSRVSPRPNRWPIFFLIFIDTFPFFFYWPLWKPRFWFHYFFFLTLKRKALQRQISYSSIWALLDCVS